MQSKQGKKTVTYTILTQLNYSFDLVLDGDYNVAMVLVADQNLETTIQMSNQEARIEELHNKFKALKDKCRNLLQEYAKRLNTSMKEWSEEKAMKYEQLKLNYHRCVERLRQIYFPQAQGIGED
jgi:vacuolar-type H+-ATPase subunit I/STV1